MFLQPDWFDVMQLGVGTNRFSYSFNDPINKADQNGNAWDDWFLDQKSADQFNLSEAESLTAAAQRLQQDNTWDGFFSRLFGGVGNLQSAAVERRDRIGQSQSDRIRMDVGELAGTALMGIRPMRAGAIASPKVGLDYSPNNSVATGANSANAGSALKSKLNTLQSAQGSSVTTRTLSDGRVRYYGEEKAASTYGPTRGARLATEFNPATGTVRQWYESVNHSGQVVRVHPKSIDGQNLRSQHYPPTGREIGSRR